MSRRTTKNSEPSRASLAEMPEVDFSKVRTLSRGKYAERARRSLEILALDKKLVTALGGPDAVSAILRALAAALGERKPKKHRAA
jgi:hypothetical protein